jgi:hypothetical protein
VPVMGGVPQGAGRPPDPGVELVGRQHGDVGGRALSRMLRERR